MAVLYTIRAYAIILVRLPLIRAIGRAVRAERKAQGYTQTDLAELCGVSLSDLMLVECLCLSTARMCGVDVPALDLLDLKVPALCIERYELKRPLTLFLK